MVLKATADAFRDVHQKWARVASAIDAGAVSATDLREFEAALNQLVHTAADDHQTVKRVMADDKRGAGLAIRTSACLELERLRLNASRARTWDTEAELFAYQLGLGDASAAVVACTERGRVPSEQDQQAINNALLIAGLAPPSDTLPNETAPNAHERDRGP